MFGVLNTLLYFPSGAVYPQQAFPSWMRGHRGRAIRSRTRVHALKSLLLKDTGLIAVMGDLTYLLLFTGITLGIATALFRRTL